MHVDHIRKLLFYASLWSLTIRGKSLLTLSYVGFVKAWYAYKPSGKAKALLKTAHIIIAHISSPCGSGSRPPHRSYNACDSWYHSPYNRHLASQCPSSVCVLRVMCLCVRGVFVCACVRVCCVMCDSVSTVVYVSSAHHLSSAHPPLHAEVTAQGPKAV